MSSFKLEPNSWNVWATVNERVVDCKRRGVGGGDKVPSPTDTEEASYRRKLLLQMSDPPNRRITSCFSPLELDNIPAALSTIPTTRRDHTYT